MRIALGPQRTPRAWAALLALAALLAVLALGLSAAGAPASLKSRLDAKQHQLDTVKHRRGVLTTTVSRYTGRIDALQGQVAALRDREAAVQLKLDRKQRQLRRAMAVLDKEKAHLIVVRGHLMRALVGLRERLVSIYESGQPDIVSVILNSSGWSDLASRSVYLDRLQEQDQSLIDRVRQLRNEVRSVVDRLRAAKDQIQTARDAIAAHKADIVRTRSAIQGRQATLVRERGKRQSVLDRIKAHEQKLDGDVSNLQAKIAAKLAPGNALPAGSIQPGSHGIIWPVNGPIVSGFGWRFGHGEFHEGVDIAVPTGTPIRAAASGTVSIAGWVGGYGNYTCIDHGGGLSTCYGHQESFAVSAGQQVTQGQIIGYSDCTGHCFGPHVHFEVRVNGQPVDPMGYL